MQARSQRKWAFDLCPSRAEGVLDLADPPGYSRAPVDIPDASRPVPVAEEAKKQEIKYKRAMEIGWSPGKNLFMTGFMMWMSGSGINIFSIMITGMAVFNPLKSLFGIKNAFAKLDDGKIDLTVPKLTFIAMNCLGVAMALYKCGKMGLLPITSVDWTHLLEERIITEEAIGGLPVGVSL